MTCSYFSNLTWVRVVDKNTLTLFYEQLRMYFGHVMQGQKLSENCLTSFLRLFCLNEKVNISNKNLKQF